MTYLVTRVTGLSISGCLASALLKLSNHLPGNRDDLRAYKNPVSSSLAPAYPVTGKAGAKLELTPGSGLPG